MATNKVVGGDYEGYEVISVFGSVSLAKGFTSIPLNKQNIDKVEILTEESKKKFLGAAGLGLAGGLLLGPLGLVAGALAGGNKKEVCFACYLKDGKKFMAVCENKVFQKVMSLSF